VERSQVALTGREKVLRWLQAEIRRAKTSDLHRAAAFLEWAYQIRKGSRQQRTGARVAQSNAWRRKVDEPGHWGL
jgi:hypothetical protein